MIPKELLTRRKIELLASPYTGLDLSSQIEGNRFVFVSHSSSDKDFIKKVILFLKFCKGGMDVYVDWRDSSLPSETDGNTAEVIKQKIKKAKKVIYVVTYESLKSVWCSWEIGYADRDKSIDDIAILAIKPNNGKWKNNEYLQQYPWISYEIKRNLFFVHLVDGNTVTLYEWLTKESNNVMHED